MRRPKIKTKHLQQLTKIIFVILLIISLFVPTFSAFAFEVEAINTIDLQNRTAWQNLPKYTELGQNYQSEVVDQMKSFQQNPDQFLSNQSVSAEQKEKLIDDLDKISLHGVAKKLDDIQSDVEKEALYNQLDSDDESTIDSLKQAQIIDTYIDPVSKEEKIIDPLLVETDGYLTAKATPHNLQIPDHSNQSLSLSFSGIEENSQAVDYNLSFSPVSTNNVEVGFEDNQALYADAWNNVDAVYSSQSNGVKEDLVLKSDPTDQTDIRQSGYQGNGNWIFYYKLNLTNLTPAIVNNKVVYKNSAGNIVATSTSPYLIDNQGEISQNAYYDLITDETYQAGYQIDQSKFNLVSSDENDQTVVVHPTSDSDESDQTKPISTTVDESDQTAAAVIQTTEHSRSLFDMISEAIKYVINIFAGSRTMAEENDQTIPSAVNNDNYESDQTIAPIDQIGQEDNAAQIIDQTPVVSYSYLVLVANTAQLQYPIDIDPTTYILTQSNLYNTTNGKLLSNNVNDVKVYDTTKEISSNYSENLKLKNTLSFNNSIAEFDLTSTNIAGQWSFDERSGGVAVDSSGHSYDGSLDQSPGRINGKMNSAL
ncbi:MAG TPA: hypothetical protein PLZ62_02075, partial [bacterium]|nr:hypothetical protein [bacterium]